MKRAERTYLHDINWKGFKSFLQDEGMILLPPTNEWEIVRYKIPLVGPVFIVYQNKKGRQSWMNGSLQHYRKYQLQQKRAA